MVVKTEYVDIPVDQSPMRMFVAAPAADGQYPGIWCYSDIFQLSAPLQRSCVRLAGYGFVVAAPEIYHRVEPAGTVIVADDPGRTRGLEDAQKTPVAHFDADCRAGLDWLGRHPKVSPGMLGAMGFCIGGHLAFRAALQPDVLATACFYGTGIHDGRLGKDADAGSLQRAGEIKGELLMVFGTEDPHVPSEGRDKIDTALRATGIRYTRHLYPAQHAFMKDEGIRYDPECTDQAFADMIALFRRILKK
ncbi:MAG TPA: dienelactone hydrolase family protein [Bryobacteraceae bacterium]|nr:dienelactone hydrolase family protein [Bryobacteraceae bacterium]